MLKTTASSLAALVKERLRIPQQLLRAPREIARNGSLPPAKDAAVQSRSPQQLLTGQHVAATDGSVARFGWAEAIAGDHARAKRTAASSESLSIEDLKAIEGLGEAKKSGPRDLFMHVKSFLPEEDRVAIMNGISQQEDPVSRDFVKREKAIRFCTVLNGEVQAYSQDYFIQSSDYNAQFGGFKRRYQLIPEDIVRGPLGKMILKFAAHYGLPEKTTILAQIQTSKFEPFGEDNTKTSIDGQGIHTDGADRAGIVILHRGRKVLGACNQFHAKLDGSQPLCEPRALANGEGFFFKDNAVYHHVTPFEPFQRPGDASGDFAHDDFWRTTFIMHAPADFLMTGMDNVNNTLGANTIPVMDTPGIPQSQQEVCPGLSSL